MRPWFIACLIIAALGSSALVIMGEDMMTGAMPIGGLFQAAGVLWGLLWLVVSLL